MTYREVAAEHGYYKWLLMFDHALLVEYAVYLTDSEIHWFATDGPLFGTVEYYRVSWDASNVAVVDVEAEVSSPQAPCTCDFYAVILVSGCKCGAMQREREAA